MPLNLGEKARLDCARNPDSSICQLLPFISRYDLDETHKEEGKTLRVLFSAQSTEAIIYVVVVLMIYVFVFAALFYSSRTESRSNPSTCESEPDQNAEIRKSETVIRLKNKTRYKCETESLDGLEDNYV